MVMYYQCPFSCHFYLFLVVNANPPYYFFHFPQQIERMSSVLLLFIVLAATGLRSNTLAQCQPGAYKPLHNNSAYFRSGYIDSDAKTILAEVDPSVGGRLQSRNHYSQRILTEEDEHISLYKEVVDHSNTGIERRHVTLAIAVPSIRPNRRKAIRETWLKWAGDRVVLRFFTEPPSQAVGDQSAEEIAERLEEESLTYGDLVLQDIDTGMNFGLKLLSAMRWMSSHFSFDFFLRLDDDYFLCLERLLEDLDCLLLTEKQHPPIVAGFRICSERATYVDEAYLLFSSLIVDRVLNTSDVMCSEFGSYTAAAWMTVGGSGNPTGDVLTVHDYRLDHLGLWWRNPRKAEYFRADYSPMCERGLGVHRTYPEGMHNIWMEVSGRRNVTQSTGDCKSSFRYEDDGQCPALSSATRDTFLQRDNFQPCDSFSSQRNKIWCGRQGC